MARDINSSPLVSICCTTYNHENYLRLCLDGFVMQQTNFSFEVLVHEDASTDKTALILREYEAKYPQLFRCVYQIENQFLKQNTLINILFPMARGKYIALCEGDDYWTDAYKLQKQVDFLEEKIEYTICWTKYQFLTLNNHFEAPEWINQVSFNNGKYDVALTTLFNPYATYTLTSLFRREIVASSSLANFKYFKDNTIYALCLTRGKGAVLNFDSAVYRLHNGGIWSAASEINKNLGNYFNLKEIIEKINGAKKNHLITTKKSFFDYSYASACHQNSEEASFALFFKVYKEILKEESFNNILKSTKELIKQLFLSTKKKFAFAGHRIKSLSDQS